MVTTNRLAFAALLALSCDRTDLLPAGDAEMQKQRLTVPLFGGIATGTDGKQLPIGKSEELQNVRPGRIGEVIQRNGTSALGTALLGAGGGTLPASWALGTLRSDLVSFSGVGDHPANAYSPAGDSWATDAANSGSTNAPVKTKRRGPILATRQQISGNGSFPDMVYASGFYFVIYSTTRNGVAMIVATAIEAATGNPVMESTHSGTFLSWGVRVVNGSAVFIYATAALITIETWSATAPGSGVLTTITAAKAVANLGRQFDMAVKDASTISAAYCDGGFVLQAFDYVPLAGAATFWTPKDSAAASVGSLETFSWVQDFGGSGKIALATGDGVNGLRMLWDIPTAGATRQAVSTYVLDNTMTSAGAVTAFTRSNSATGEFTAVYENSIGSGVLWGATRESGALAKAVIYRSLSLDSKAFVGADGKYYVGTAYSSAVQPTRFVARVPETLANLSRLTAIVAKTQINNGYISFAVSGPLCPVSSPAAGEYIYANTVQLRLPGNPTAYVPQGVGVDIVHVKFKTLPDTTTGPPREAIDSLFTPGGNVGQFDGRTYCDAGFNYYPEQPAVPTQATIGGTHLTLTSTYYSALVYRWIDANGRTWRSKPSAVQSFLLTGTNNQLTYALPTYRLADRDDIAIEFYRGAANDNVTLALIGTAVNDPTVDTVTFVDNFADAVVQNGEALYTNGQPGSRPLGNDGIPGFSSIAVTADRAWGVSNDNPYEVWPSNKFIPGQGWRFSEQNKLIFNDSFGPVIGVAKQPSGVVVVFKANAYYLVSGDGPNQAGNGGSFTVSQPIIGAGTSNPRSLLETPSGIEFRQGIGTRGWYRVNTANQTEYIGMPLERYASSVIVGAALIPSTGETRYFTSTANNGDVRTMVHDPISDTWMVDTSQVDLGVQFAAVAYGIGAATAIGATIYIDNASTPGADAGNQFLVLDTTPWIKGADLDGYVTFIRARGVGEAGVGAPTVTVALQADFDASTNLALETAAPGTQWDWEIKYLAKLSAFRFVISYFASAVPVKMSAIVVEYGVKSGMAPGAFTKRMQ